MGFGAVWKDFESLRVFFIEESRLPEDDTRAPPANHSYFELCLRDWLLLANSEILGSADWLSGSFIAESLVAVL